MGLVAQLVFKTSSGRITPSVAGSIPALSARVSLFFVRWSWCSGPVRAGRLTPSGFVSRP